MARINFQGGVMNRPTYITDPSLPESVRDTIHAATRCVGTDCMMWRWTDYRRYEGNCGLAGAPVSGT